MYKYIKLFVGLGNPDKMYYKTRHNYGAIILNEIAKSIGLNFNVDYDKKISIINYYNNLNFKIWLLKPLVAINLSGEPISRFMKHHKIKPIETFIFYDDCSVLLGKYKIKMSGSSGGHNGINSLIEYIKSYNFVRMKLGIGPLPQGISMAEFVLSKFTNLDDIQINSVKKIAVTLFHKINLIGLEKAIASINQQKFI
jgi:PTH1 family peptidyl-tRNA hydrolase